MTRYFIEAIKEYDDINEVYMVTSKQKGTTKSGKPFITIELTDKSGKIEGKIWNNAEDLWPLFDAGDLVSITAKTTSFKNKLQLKIDNITKCENPLNLSDFIISSRFDEVNMENELKELVSNISNKWLNQLALKFISEKELFLKFLNAPASKNIHHNFRCGLLEHTLGCVKLASIVGELYPHLDKDLLIIGALFHDIGKTIELSKGPAIDYTLKGRLLGHIVIGTDIIQKLCEKIDGFPEELETLVKHMIIAHHGELEYGSPQVPQIAESFILHYIDQIDSKQETIRTICDKIEPGAWSDYNRPLERFLLKTSCEPEQSDNNNNEVKKVESKPVIKKQKTDLLNKSKNLELF